MVSATDRDLWRGPKQEVHETRTSGFCAQPQKFETITVTIGYKNGQLLRLRVTLAPARDLDLWRWPKGSQLWERECSIMSGSQTIRAEPAQYGLEINFKQTNNQRLRKIKKKKKKKKKKKNTHISTQSFRTQR